jgi:hypothetical protein
MDILDVLYNENKKYLHMPKDINHPINHKKAYDWIYFQNYNDVKFMASKIIKYTTHISFKKFLADLITMVKSYVRKHKKDKNTEFFLILTRSVSKSNIWCMMLVYPYIKDLITDVYFSITDVYMDITNKKNDLHNKIVRCIILDDCIYTGTQMKDYASFEPSVILSQIYNGREISIYDSRWLKLLTGTQEKFREHMNKIALKKFSVDVLVPYCSTIGYKSIKDIPYVRIYNNVKIFKTFIENLGISYDLSALKGTFQFHKDISTIYFDHKIADSLSVFNKIYYLGPLFYSRILHDSKPFIDGCSSEDKIKKLKKNKVDTHNFYENMEYNVPGICPGTFYKSIKYTYKGKVIKDLTNLIGK